MAVVVSATVVEVYAPVFLPIQKEVASSWGVLAAGGHNAATISSFSRRLLFAVFDCSNVDAISNSNWLRIVHGVLCQQ